MPKNKGKGGKNRRRGKNENDVMKRELVEKDGDNQAYAQVMKMLGNGRLTAFCFDGKTRLCHIRGKLRKKVWINTGDIILVGLRDYQDDKADVILKYTPDEARLLKNTGQLPESAKLNEIGEDQNEGEVEFIDSGERSHSEDEVALQDRNYIIDSSESESDDDESDDEEAEAKPTDGKKVAQPAAAVKKDKPDQKLRFESSDDSDDEDEEDSDEDSDKAAAARIRSERVNKPGARDHYKPGGGKGKRGK